MTEAIQKTLASRAEVLEAMPDHPAVKALLAWRADSLLDARFDRGELTLTVAPDSIREAAATVQAAGYNFFEDMTAVDWFPSAPRFQLSYHILSHKLLERIRLRVMLEETNPAVESITPVWPAANYYEREVFDLFGIRFEGHPNLRRIMMPDEWQGHPLRKDYPVEGYR
ncbi:MAG: NADH-quinone oxidoreductase subunit C [Acidobacteriota bacterium]|nr:NADH-quinone oxidoreductase subunit C [Acidobacteriota bacterium]